MKKVTVICEGGWKYTGDIEEMKMSPIGSLQWIKLNLHRGSVKIHAKYIVAIIELVKRNENRKENYR
jgi:hypothetical protein